MQFAPFGKRQQPHFQLIFHLHPVQDIDQTVLAG